MFSSSPKSKLRKDFNLFVLTQKTPCNPLQNTTYQSAQALKLKKQETPESLIKQPNTAEISLFLELINEQKRLLHYKRLSKVYENIFSFISKDNRGFFLGFEIRMLRIFLLTILKRVKNSLVKKVTNFSKTMNLIHQCLSVFKNYYKFLTTYINTTKLHLNPKHVLDQSKNEYPSLSDISSNENESGNENLPPFIDIISGKHGSFNEFPNKINSRFESSCFIAKLLELLLLNGFFFKRTGNFTLAFKYLKKASTTALKLDFSFNPDILNLCAKAHLSLAVLFLDFGKVRKAEKLLNLGSILLQAELVYRMGLGGFQGSELKKNERLRVKRTVKTLVSCLVNMIFCFSTRKAIVKIAETTILLDNLMGVYLSQNDEFRKAVMKMIKEFRKKYLLGIEEISEIEEIIDGFLKHDYYFQKKLNPFYFPNERKDMNITSYKSPKIHNLIHPIIKKAPEPKKQRKQSISKRLSLDLRTLKNVEGIVNLDSITKRTASTLKKVDFPLELINKGPSDIKRTDRPQPFTNSKDLTMETFLLADFFDNSFNKSENEKSSFFSDLSEAHLKETFEFPLDLKPKTIKGFIPLKDDYKPKILTTDQYFTKKKPIEKPVILSNEKNFDGVLLDSLIHYPWKPFTKEKPDDRYQRDFFTEGFAKIIEKTLKEGKDFKSPKKMNEDFVKLLKINEFDRDEFKSGKRLLEAKRMANLNKESNLKNIAGGFIPTHSLNSDIKVQAEVFLHIFLYNKEFLNQIGGFS